MSGHTIPSYIMSLDDLGDLQAPKGSQPWARAVRYQLQCLARQSKTSVRDFQTYLKLLEDHLGYQQLDDDQGYPFATLSAFAVAQIPFGLGYDPEIVLHIQEETRDMLLTEKVQELQGQPRPKRGRPIKIAKFANLSQQQRAEQNGVSHYTQKKLDYLAGHDPDLLREVQQGTLSTHAAYQRAKGKAPETPLSELRRAWNKASDAERIQFFYETPDSERNLLVQTLARIEALTPLDYLHRYWRQVLPDDRLRFLCEMLTPKERRALQLGLEDDAEEEA